MSTSEVFLSDEAATDYIKEFKADSYYSPKYNCYYVLK